MSVPVSESRVHRLWMHWTPPRRMLADDGNSEYHTKVAVLLKFA
jgi:hypothetical protein